MIIPRGNPHLRAESISLPAPLRPGRGGGGRGTRCHTWGARGRWWVAAVSSKAPWENSFSLGRAMSAGNLKHLVMGVAGGGGLVQVPLFQRDGDAGGVGWGKKLRVMLHTGDKRANPPLFPLGSSWVKTFASSASPSVKWTAALKEICQLMRTVGESARVLPGWENPGVQLQHHFPACGTPWRGASFVSTLLQVENQRRLFPFLPPRPPSSSSQPAHGAEPATSKPSFEQVKAQQLRRRQR